MITLTELPSPIRLRWPLEAVIDTALCVGAGGTTGSISDKPIIRNAQGQLVIPGSQLKGRLRHECEKLARSLGWWIPDAPMPKNLYLTDSTDEEAEDGTDAGEQAELQKLLAPFKAQYREQGYPGYHCWVSKIFGDPILPSRIVVNDLICHYDKEALPDVIRPGVSINRRRQTSEDQKLFYLETSPMGAGLPFKGEIHLLHDCPAYAEPLLLVAIAHIRSLGGGKSGGLGWLHWRQSPTLSSNVTIDKSSLMPQPVSES